VAPSTALTIKPISTLTSIVAQLFRAPQTEIRGIEQTDWFGPGQPVKPIAPVGTEPRGWQFFPNQNFIYTPRANEPMTGDDLRQASMYDMVRIIIENVLDQMTRIPVNVRLKRMPGESAKDYAKRKPDPGVVAAIMNFIDHPNPDETRGEFLRKLLDDMLVGDFASVLLRKTPKGELLEMRAIDGATICRYIDKNGFTPQAPSPAYAQLWYGIPMVDLTTQQLIYAPRNLKTYRLYGMSPVEQAIRYIRTGALRLAFQESYYKDGNIPDAMQIVPKGVHPDKIKETEQWLISELGGQLNRRRQIKLVQGFTEKGDDQVLFPKQALLTDPFDDLVITALCFAFGTSKQRLMKQMNRASAEASQDAAEKEGLEPFLDWEQNSIYNRLIQNQNYLNMPMYEATCEQDTDVDPKVQADIDKIYLSCGARTINQVKENLGDEPFDIPEADMPMIITATGPIPVGVDATVDRQTKIQQAQNENQPEEPNAGGDNPPAKGKSGPTEKRYRRLARAQYIRKSRAIVLDPRRSKNTTHVARVERAVHKVFSRQKEKAKERARFIKEKHEKVAKAGPASPSEMFDAIWKEIVNDFAEMHSEVKAGIEDAVHEGINDGILQLSLDDSTLIAKANTVAGEYAETRAAQLVGKRVGENGELVDNPSAKWAIDDGTRDELKRIIKASFDEETPYADLVNQIEEATAFSASRAQLVARTEVATAQIKGNFDVWKASGLVEKVQWMANDEPCDECEGNDEEIRELGEPFPSGDLSPLAHPNCECLLVAVEISDGGDE
jgi:phage portal protein BeeE